MNKDQVKELNQRIDEVLYYVWDPIGVSDTPAARGEYSTYVETIQKYVMEEDIQKITDHLSKIETDAMGLTANRENNLFVAQKLLDYKNAIEQGLK